MAASEFHLVTEWVLPAPPAGVWKALTHLEEWPKWWQAVERVELIEPGNADGLGAYRRFTWRTALPYRIRFNMRVTRIERIFLIEGRADGELSGIGRWTLTPVAGERDDGTRLYHATTGEDVARASQTRTRVRYDWIVEVDRSWMRALAPLLHPLFVWNHNRVMAWGHEGIVRKLAEGERTATTSDGAALG